MDKDETGPSEKGDEEDVIPSSQGEVFSSQSSTPDLLTPSLLVPILQPSQSSDAADTTPTHFRPSKLLPTTPTELVRMESSTSSSEARPSLSASPSVRDIKDDTEPERPPSCQAADTRQGERSALPQLKDTAQTERPTSPELTGTQEEELSPSPHVTGSPPEGPAVTDTPREKRPASPEMADDTHREKKRPASPEMVDDTYREKKRPASPGLTDTPRDKKRLASPELTDTPQEKRARTSTGADDSDIQFVEEVPPDDLQVMYSSRAGGSVQESLLWPPTPSEHLQVGGDEPSGGAAESQAGFQLNFSPSQSEQMSDRPVDQSPQDSDLPEAQRMDDSDVRVSDGGATGSDTDHAQLEGGGAAAPSRPESHGRDPVQATPADAGRVQAESHPSEQQQSEASASSDPSSAVSGRGPPTGADCQLPPAERDPEPRQREEELLLLTNGESDAAGDDGPSESSSPLAVKATRGKSAEKQHGSPPSQSESAVQETPCPSGEESQVAPCPMDEVLQEASCRTDETPREAAHPEGKALPDVPARSDEASQEAPRGADEGPEGGHTSLDPYRFHGTQSQDTQPYQHLPLSKFPSSRVLDKGRQIAPSTSHSSGRQDTGLSKSVLATPESISALLAEGEVQVRRGSVLKMLQISATWVDPTGQTRDIAVDEPDVRSFMKWISISCSSSMSTGTGTSSGYAGDVSSGASKSSSGASKRMSTLSSATLSTIEGRGARHSVASSLDSVALAASQQRRASIVSVLSCSPGSDVEIIPASASEVKWPDGRRARPHGRPAASSSLLSAAASLPDESEAQRAHLAGVIATLESPPAATSTQTELSPPPAGAAAATATVESSRSPGAAGRSAAKVSFAESQAADGLGRRPGSSEETHVTGTSSSPEIARLPTPLPPDDTHRLTDAEEEELSGREQASLGSRPLQPDMVCFAQWVDQSYYPGRLVHAGRDGRWLVRFDDDTQRQVLASQVLPVHTLWKGLSVFVSRDDASGYYESAIITGHRMAASSDALDYIVSMDSASVTCAVSRGRLLMTRDQAGLLTERRTPAAAPLTVGSPTRHLSLDNLVTGRRRAASTATSAASSAASSTAATVAASVAAGRRLPDFDASSGQEPADSCQPRRSGRASKLGTSVGSPRRKRSRVKDLTTPLISPGSAQDVDAGSGAGLPTSGGTRASRSGGQKRSTNTKRTPAAAPPATPKAGARRSRVKSSGTPAKSSGTPATEPGSAATAATPSGRKRKRMTASTPEQVEPPAELPAETSAVSTPRARTSRARTNRDTASTVDTSDAAYDLFRPLEEFAATKSVLFRDLTVILTCATAAASTAEAQRKRVLSAPFDKQHVSRHIRCRGGRVLLDVALDAADVQRVRGKRDLLLISNGPLRTTKYLLCLAMGVPCVQMRWLVDSIKLKQRMPYEDYLLPAGENSRGACLDQLLHQQPPLSALKALVADTADSDWGHSMTQILAAAGAEVKLDHQFPGGTAESFRPDVVVAQPTSPAAVLEWADSAHVPVVSGEWVIVSVISYKRQAVDGRPEFHFSSRPAPADQP